MTNEQLAALAQQGDRRALFDLWEAVKPFCMAAPKAATPSASPNFWNAISTALSEFNDTSTRGKNNTPTTVLFGCGGLLFGDYCVIIQVSKVVLTAAVSTAFPLASLYRSFAGGFFIVPRTGAFPSAEENCRTGPA